MQRFPKKSHCFNLICRVFAVNSVHTWVATQTLHGISWPLYGVLEQYEIWRLAISGSNFSKLRFYELVITDYNTIPGMSMLPGSVDFCGTFPCHQRIYDLFPRSLNLAGEKLITWYTRKGDFSQCWTYYFRKFHGEVFPGTSIQNLRNSFLPQHKSRYFQDNNFHGYFHLQDSFLTIGKSKFLTKMSNYHASSHSGSL